MVKLSIVSMIPKSGLFGIFGVSILKIKYKTIKTKKYLINGCLKAGALNLSFYSSKKSQRKSS